MQGLDEPNEYSLSYGIGFDTTYTGFTTVQAINSPHPTTDYDDYKFSTPVKTNVSVSINNIALANLKVRVVDSGYNTVGTTIYSNGSSSINFTQIVNTGNYYLEIYGTPTSTSYLYPYNFTLNQAPVANFAFTSTCGVTFNFSDLSTGNGSTWNWNLGDGNYSALQNPTHTYSTAGTYSVTLIVSNTYGIDTIQQVVNVFSVVATVSQTNVSCNGGSNGLAMVSSSGGTSPFTYSWSNSQTTQTVTGLFSGTYTVIITDANSCTATNTVIITQPLALITSMSVTNASSCSASDGSVTVNVSGGTLSYTYSWSNSKTTATITGLSSGTYTLTITDAKNCTKTLIATVGCPNAIAQVFEENNFTISPNPSSGAFTIQDRGQLTIMKIEIYNVLGEKVYLTSNLKPQTTNEVDLSKQSNGIYFLHLKTEQGTVTKKLIIQK